MSVSTILPIAFRCTKCWQLTSAGSDQVGSKVPCICCSTTVTVPDVTDDRIKAGEEFASNVDAPKLNLDLNQDLTDEQIYQMARKKVDQEFKATGHPKFLVCSRWKRLIGTIVDSLAGLVAVGVGILVAATLGHIIGLENRPLIAFVMIGIPVCFGMFQLHLIASKGQTVGKYFVKSKIVNAAGQPPGFFCGVVMRTFAVTSLGLIPFFSLIDICWIFYQPKRCLHDIIAGTYVIDA